MRDRNFLLSVISFFIILLGLCLLRVAVQLGWLDALGRTGVSTFFSVGAQIVLMLLIPLIVFTIANRKTEGEKRRFKSFRAATGFLGFKRISAKVVGYSFLAGAVMFLFNIFITTIFGSILSAFGYRFPTYGSSELTGILALVYGLFFSAILPGICEETTHRGMLLNGMRSKLGLKGALIFSSIMFGLMHLNVAQFFFATVLGFIMGLVTVVTRSIWPAVIMHFSNNAILSYLGVAKDSGWVLGNFFDVLNKILSALPFGLIIVIVLAIALGKLIMSIIKRLIVESGVDANTAVEILKPQKREKLTLFEGMFFYGCLVLGGLMTIFTFIWGMM